MNATTREFDKRCNRALKVWNQAKSATNAVMRELRSSYWLGTINTLSERLAACARAEHAAYIAYLDVLNGH